MTEKSGKDIDYGCYAFPIPSSESNYAEYGMTLRDWFAGQALASFGQGDTAKDRAAFAYVIADAMIARRNED